MQAGDRKQGSYNWWPLVTTPSGNYARAFFCQFPLIIHTCYVIEMTVIETSATPQFILHHSVTSYSGIYNSRTLYEVSYYYIMKVTLPQLKR